MTNFQVYKKTLSFSLVMFLIDMLAVVLLAGITVAGFFIGRAFDPSVGPILGLVIGLVLGGIAAGLINFFITNRYKAAQIAMMVKGVSEGELPEHTFKEGKQVVKGRFASIALFFFVTNSIKSVFRQLGRTMTHIGSSIGGDVGGTVTSTIDSAIQTLIGYLCDCCLGWVFYRSTENAAKAACEGAAIFFKHGKTLLRNVGRIFGMGILSFILIGGAFTGIFYLICMQFPALFADLAKSLTEGGDLDPRIAMIVISALGGIILWSALHSVLIRPFILTGVLRNFIESGKAHVPSDAEFKEIADRCPRFVKLQEKID